MRIDILAVGRLKSGPERDLVSRYLDRARDTGRSLSLTGYDVRELNESRAGAAKTRRKEEASALLPLLAADGFHILLDERGKDLSSEKLASLIGRERDNGRKAMRFAIGGADGFDPDLRQKAHLVLSLSSLTWPHQLVRILLAEQLYRTNTILAGHPYHRA